MDFLADLSVSPEWYFEHQNCDAGAGPHFQRQEQSKHKLNQYTEDVP